MLSVLLVIIYISFISLGLPDSLLGSAWPVINQALNVPLSYAGILSMIVSGGTIVSSVLSDRLIRRFGTGAITFVSVTMTAAALIGYSFSGSFWLLCVMAVPLGLGAGAVDAALNNFVALHYKVRQMNWLHCFWGIGATLGPYIMSRFLSRQDNWQWGYRSVGVLQVCLAAVLLLSLPLWKRVEQPDTGGKARAGRALGLAEIIRLPNAKEALLSFFFYCSIELTTGLWGSTYLVETKGITAAKAAQWVSIYYLGITVGRFICGFLSIKVSNRTMIRLGLGCIGAGILILPAASLPALCLFSLMLIGLGCAPVFPGLLHETPNRFGKENAGSIMGIQMASAYVGSTVMPPVFGLIADNVSPALLPAILFVLFAALLYTTERVNVSMRRTGRAQI